MEPETPPSLFERIMATLPGWMLLLGGAAMVAMVTLVPPWLECRRLNWQTQVMAIQSQQLQSQQIAYEQFLTALNEDDPVVVERMAYYHLRLKPVGTSTLDDLNQLSHQQAAVYNQVANGTYGQFEAQLQQANALPQNKIWSTLPTIEDLLAKPMYRPNEFCPAGVVPDTRMVRLATGPARHVLLGLGVLCLFAGLLPASAAAGLITAKASNEVDEFDEADEMDEAQNASDDYWNEDGLDEQAAVVATLEADDDAITAMFPDADQTAWALAGTGAMSVSAAAGAVNTLHNSDEPVILAQLDTEVETELLNAELVDAEVEAEVDEDFEDQDEVQDEDEDEVDNEQEIQEEEYDDSDDTEDSEDEEQEEEEQEDSEDEDESSDDDDDDAEYEDEEEDEEADEDDDEDDDVEGDEDDDDDDDEDDDDEDEEEED